ncbi:MAG: hypothetical protein ACXVY9_09170 [Terriglobales bacterium]|jgi:hypothetical protein|nr:hypothetical protein [Terriglobales bacterium]
MTPAYLGLDSLEDVHRYLRHCKLSDTTPEAVLEQLRTKTQVTLNTIEWEEKIS